MDDGWFTSRFRVLARLGYLAGLGAAVLVISLVSGLERFVWAGVILILPGFVHAYLLPIWHWKVRYVGSHSDLWGALLVLEVSGWFKVVYWFRHLIPDYLGRGRYSKQAAMLRSA